MSSNNQLLLRVRVGVVLGSVSNQVLAFTDAFWDANGVISLFALVTTHEVASFAMFGYF